MGDVLIRKGVSRMRAGQTGLPGQRMMPVPVGGIEIVDCLESTQVSPSPGDRGQASYLLRRQFVMMRFRPSANRPMPSI